MEQRESPDKPLDVLVQHLVTIALGGGFRAGELFDEVRTAWAYRELTREEFDWALCVLRARRRKPDGLSRLPPHHAGRGRRLPRARRGIAKRHRLGIGTIVSDASMQVKYMSGASIGTIEEGFIARLRKGDCFFFAGRLLEFVRVQEMAAYVQEGHAQQGHGADLAGQQDGAVHRAGRRGAGDDAKARRRASSSSPNWRRPGRCCRRRRGCRAFPRPRRCWSKPSARARAIHLYVYPFAGRHVHLGLASLLAWRLARDRPNTFSMSVNDYGFELVAAEEFDLAPVLDKSVFSHGGPAARRAGFAQLHRAGAAALPRDRARGRAGFHGYPGQPKSTRQLQASSGLFFEVFRKYDKGNLLLGQAEREVLSQELEISRLRATLTRLAPQGAGACASCAIPAR